MGSYKCNNYPINSVVTWLIFLDAGPTDIDVQMYFNSFGSLSAANMVGITLHDWWDNMAMLTWSADITLVGIRIALGLTSPTKYYGPNTVNMSLALSSILIYYAKSIIFQYCFFHFKNTKLHQTMIHYFRIE